MKEYFLVHDKETGEYYPSLGNGDIKIVDHDEAVNGFNTGKYTQIISEAGQNKMLVRGHFITDPSNEDVEKVDSIPKGLYTLGQGKKSGTAARVLEVETDKYIPLSGVMKEVMSEIDVFLDSADRYKKNNILHRRNLLLYGPPGNGKSRTIVEASRKFSDRARFFDVKAVRYILEFKEYIKDMPAIFLFEEITDSARSEGRDLLNFLDGLNAMNGSMVIATTNYPERLEHNMVDRPSRFDHLVFVNHPSKQEKTEYLTAQLGNEPDKDGMTIDDIVEELGKEVSIAYLKELVVLTKVYDESIFHICKKFRDRKKLIETDFVKKARDGAGFGQEDNE